MRKEDSECTRGWKARGRRAKKLLSVRDHRNEIVGECTDLDVIHVITVLSDDMGTRKTTMRVKDQNIVSWLTPE